MVKWLTINAVKYHTREVAGSNLTLANALFVHQ
jgi:hypothetical protein